MGGAPPGVEKKRTVGVGVQVGMGVHVGAGVQVGGMGTGVQVGSGVQVGRGVEVDVGVGGRGVGMVTTVLLLVAVARKPRSGLLDVTDTLVEKAPGCRYCTGPRICGKPRSARNWLVIVMRPPP